MCNTLNVYQPLIPFHATQIIYPFLNSIISANHEKGEIIQPCNGKNPYTPNCFSSIESFDVLKCFYFAVNVLNNNEYTVKFRYFLVVNIILFFFSFFLKKMFVLKINFRNAFVLYKVSWCEFLHLICFEEDNEYVLKAYNFCGLGEFLAFDFVFSFFYWIKSDYPYDLYIRNPQKPRLKSDFRFTTILDSVYACW